MRVSLALVAFVSLASTAAASTFIADVAPLIDSSCIDCHDSNTETRLNFEDLGHDLSDPKAFRRWELVFDRVHQGEMPPSGEPRPDASVFERALASLKRDLIKASRTRQQSIGRVPLRRLTRSEYDYTIRDLLSIHQGVGNSLPAEANSAGFDTVGTNQGTSPIHIDSYLNAANQAIDLAIDLGPRPPTALRALDYLHSPRVESWYQKPLRYGGNIHTKLDDEIAFFVDSDYLLDSGGMGFKIPSAGYYRLSFDARAYQSKNLIGVTLNLRSPARGMKKLLGAWDLQPGQSRRLEVTAYLVPGDTFFPSITDVDYPEEGYYPHMYKLGDNHEAVRNYDGEGLAIRWFEIVGPSVEQWPPTSTRNLLTGVSFVEKAHGSKYEIELTEDPVTHLTKIVERILPLAFRRPALPGEIESFVKLATPALGDDRDFLDAARIAIRGILNSPQFLFHGGEPGELDDYALASRLSYFLWKSMPDEELFRLAANGELSSANVLAQQVNRLLDDDKSNRFVEDFLGQWLGLHDIDTTTPDQILYPEYSDTLRAAMLKETELFFSELLKEDLSIRNLIDSDFAFLNRRLADHYGISGVHGEQFRRVALPVDSPRGGILTHASVLKVTANGTVTSPVTRGNFVLTTILGDPPNPPPPGAGAIEPDTRGTTTIREMLDAHRNVEECASCHRKIDPPGFALECFDPIGRFRTRYRANKLDWIPAFPDFYARNAKFYSEGLDVDASGVTVDGKAFSDVREFKQHLLEQEDQVARHVIALLIEYATGGEIQFADREHVDNIARRMHEQDYPLRAIIHEIVQSPLFRRM